MALKVHAEKRCASGRGAGDKQAPALTCSQPSHAVSASWQEPIHSLGVEPLGIPGLSPGRRSKSNGSGLPRLGLSVTPEVSPPAVNRL